MREICIGSQYRRKEGICQMSDNVERSSNVCSLVVICKHIWNVGGKPRLQ